MRIFSLIWGVIVFMIFTLALIPCLGWMNWLNIPAGLFGVVFGILGMIGASQARQSPGPPIAGLVLSLCAACLGLVRLLLGGGIF